jgi:ribonuclease R
VNYLLLRSMAQAYYGPDSLGHFALASTDYCHFTSPIRRYPDLVNHRALNVYLRTEAGVPLSRVEADVLPETRLAELGQRTSAAERRAQLAERDAKALLLLSFMKDKVGQTFDGLITGVTSFGAFVQVRPHLAEGLVHVSDFGPERWEYDERAGVQVGRTSGCMVALGQPVRVQVISVDEFRQEMRLAPVGRLGVARGPRRRRHAPGGERRPNRGRSPKGRNSRRGRR